MDSDEARGPRRYRGAIVPISADRNSGHLSQNDGLRLTITVSAPSKWTTTWLQLLSKYRFRSGSANLMPYPDGLSGGASPPAHLEPAPFKSTHFLPLVSRCACEPGLSGARPPCGLAWLARHVEHIQRGRGPPGGPSASHAALDTCALRRQRLLTPPVNYGPGRARPVTRSPDRPESPSDRSAITGYRSRLSPAWCSSQHLTSGDTAIQR